MRSSASILILNAVSVCNDVAPLESVTASIKTFKIVAHIDNIMSWPEDQYKDVLEVVSQCPIIACKAANDGVPGMQNHILNIYRVPLLLYSHHILFLVHK